MLGLRLMLGAIGLMGVMTAAAGALALVSSRAAAKAPAVVLQVDGVGSYWQALIGGAQDAADRIGSKLTVIQGCQLTHPETAALSIVGGQLRATCGMDSEQGSVELHVGMANYSAGKECAKLAHELLPAGGKIVTIVDGDSTSPSAVRLQGFRDHWKKLKFRDGRGNFLAVDFITEKIEPLNGQSTEDQMKLIVARHGDAALAFDFTGNPADHLKRAYAEGEATPQLVSFDQSDAALKLVDTGELSAVVALDAYKCGYLAFERLVDLQSGSILAHPSQGKGFILLPPTIVRAGEVADYRATLPPSAADGAT